MDWTYKLIASSSSVDWCCNKLSIYDKIQNKERKNNNKTFLLYQPRKQNKDIQVIPFFFFNISSITNPDEICVIEEP